MVTAEKLSIDKQRELDNLKGAIGKLKEAYGYLKGAASSIKGNSLNQLRANAIVAKGRVANAFKKILEMQMTQVNLELLAGTAREEAANVQSIKITNEQNFTVEYVSSQARALDSLREALESTAKQLSEIAEEKDPQKLPELKQKAEAAKQAIENHAKELESLTRHVDELYKFLTEVRAEAAREKVMQRQTPQPLRKPWWQFW
ncbi:hypothetical protein HYU12_03385 [Candidatus Woesearchaeota archaeon]|nr:hypothetical protein [Candidatus Woesearchaeota archaeon]